MAPRESVTVQITVTVRFGVGVPAGAFSEKENVVAADEGLVILNEALPPVWTLH